MNTGRENDEKTFVKTCSLQSCWNLIQRIECFCFVRDFFFFYIPPTSSRSTLLSVIHHIHYASFNFR